jgi:hypothetical protein
MNLNRVLKEEPGKPICLDCAIGEGLHHPWCVAVDKHAIVYISEVREIGKQKCEPLANTAAPGLSPSWMEPPVDCAASQTECGI